MRIPINWLGEFVRLPSNIRALTDKLTMAGHMLDKVEKVDGNIIIDLELRSNRADCYCIEGIAKEVSALFSTPIRYPKVDIKLKKVKKLSEINLNVRTPLVRRVMMATIRNVKIEPSPTWMATKIKEYGIESINNIVDLTNYVMLETGQPMHAFDLEKIGNELEIRLANEGENMITFLGKSLSLTKNDLVWANKHAILSVAGAIGGKQHSIASSTKNILLEAASYDRANIRRSIHKHSLFTDAGIRHEKDLDSNIVESAIYRFLDLIEKNKWGKVGNEVSDSYPKPVNPRQITLRFDYLYSLGGLKIETRKIKQILESLNFKVVKNNPNEIVLEVPTYRTDVTCQEDLIEEVIRIYGYDKIPTQTLSLEIPKRITPQYIDQEINIRNIMSSLGFDEIISSSFVKEGYLKHNKPFDEKKYMPVKVQNKPSPDVEILRMSLFPNILEFVRKIINERGTEALLFEEGKVYFKDKSGYVEKRKLGIVYCQKEDLEFVYFKGLLEALFSKLNLDDIEFNESEMGLQLLYGVYKISKDKRILGFGGQFENLFYAEIDLDALLELVSKPKIKLWPKHPPQIEDVTIKIPTKTKIGDVLKAMLHSNELVSDIELRDTYKDSYTFRVWYQAKNKTLNDQEVEKIRNKMLTEVKNKFGGVVKD